MSMDAWAIEMELNVGHAPSYIAFLANTRVSTLISNLANGSHPALSVRLAEADLIERKRMRVRTIGNPNTDTFTD